MLINVDNKVMEVQLRTWEDGCGYGVDCLSDVCGIDFNKFDNDDDGNIVMTKREFDAFCEFWNNEAERANADDNYMGDGLSGRNFSSLSDDEEYVFTVEEW